MLLEEACPEPVERAIATRRSIRRFAPRPVTDAAIRDLVALACTAPSPHGSRPWRFVHVASPEAPPRPPPAEPAAGRPRPRLSRLPQGRAPLLSGRCPPGPGPAWGLGAHLPRPP